MPRPVGILALCAILVIAVVVAVLVLRWQGPEVVAPADPEPEAAASRDDGDVPVAVGELRSSGAGEPRADEPLADDRPAVPVGPAAASESEGKVVADGTAELGVVLRGRVFTFASEPVIGARVLLLPPLAGRAAPPAAVGGNVPVAESGADGRFSVRFHDSAARDVVVSAPGFAPVVVAALDPGLAPDELAVRLPRGAVVHGAVRSAAGREQAAIRVEVWLEREAPATAEPGLGVPPLCRGGQFVAAMTTGVDGRFRFEGLPPRALVVGLAPAHGPGRARVVLMPGEERRLDLQLQEPGCIRGTADPGTLVVLYSPAAKRFGEPAADRSFEFRDVPPGTWLLCAVCEPIATNLHAIVQEHIVSGQSTLAREINLASGATVTIDLPPARDCTGTVRGSAWIDGRSAAGSRVVLRPVTEVGAHVRRGEVAADGSFEVVGVPGGSYDAELVLPGGDEVVVREACTVRIGLVTDIRLIAR